MANSEGLRHGIKHRRAQPGAAADLLAGPRLYF
jgi:hypothetical protein